MSKNSFEKGIFKLFNNSDMKSFFIFLGCLFFECSFAETIQHVEYHLPKATQDWIVGNKLESEKGTTVIYIPREKEMQNTEEFFAVQANSRFFDVNNPLAMNLELTKVFPNRNIDFYVIEKDKDSFTYEWLVQEKFYSLGRAFSNKEGTVILSYQTENIANVPQARSIWLQALKKAKQ